MNTYFECPTPYRPAPGDPPAVFLAGGIVGCPDWQSVAADCLAGQAVVLNPRRANFPIDDPSATPEQIRWEHQHLHMDGVLTLFWFPACDRQVTTQPIAMFELGAALGEQRPIVVGADPGYPRVEDVRWQASLAQPGLTVHDSLDATLTAAVAQLDAVQEVTA
ncbi:nucleoside 2-deoxyribosyltransferase-like protein [Streptomyces sp. Amel2xB2]|uniref:nucleoside 2-deoxyribosyltransferase domain-containing protein n=1 Tax=Streptomyces sp. Amel2xB2 TaxID=1305829 RepID=UPI000DBA2A97|nr:nucleoside 2-deoxyribosyltransferase domain-containing protein [Streptomyces sp. Amel2xB2]RAJ70233.1 nucleoside 2-deoxyribosyltransferase-like protein [Streptomyces sp. Amel2xB2]